MSKKMKRSIRLIALMLFIASTFVVGSFAMKSLKVGVQMYVMSDDVTFTENKTSRAFADQVYNEVKASREAFYNSDDSFVSWYSQRSGVVKILVTIALFAMVAAQLYAVKQFGKYVILNRRIYAKDLFAIPQYLVMIGLFTYGSLSGNRYNVDWQNRTVTKAVKKRHKKVVTQKAA